MSTSEIASPTRLPTSPSTAHKHLGSLATYLAIVGYLALAKIGMMLWPPVFTNASQATFFGWSAIAILGLAGLLGIWLALHTGFPEAWDATISNRQRLWLPALLGAVWGVVAIAEDVLSRQPNFPIAFPASLFVFTGGAAVIEIVYRWVPLPLALWLISGLLLRGKAQDPVFWILAVLLSALEPYAQFRALRQAGIAWLPLAVATTEIYVFDLLHAYLFRRFGFVASFALRLTYYLVWHVVGAALL